MINLENRDCAFFGCNPGSGQDLPHTIFESEMCMEILNELIIKLDSVLISFYRIPDNPVTGFFLGTLILCLACTIIGGYTSIGFAVINRKHNGRLYSETVSMHNLSVKAIAVKDKENYKNCNKLANEAFGRYFFAQFGAGASALLPVPFALAWMQLRFQEVSFSLPFNIPGIGETVSYPFIFIFLYVLCRILFRNIRNKLPFTKRMIQKILANDTSEKMLRFSDLIKPNPYTL
jgi:hypothetical protein